MKIKALLFLSMIAISFKAICQGEFEIKVIINKKYTGNYLEFTTTNTFSGFEYPRKISDSVFFIKGNCKEKYEYADFRLQQSDAISYLKIFISAGRMELKVDHLYSKDTILNVQLNGFPFQKEQEEYLKMTYAKKDNNGILKFICQHPKSYISYYLFMANILRNNVVKPDSLESIFTSLNKEYITSKKSEQADSIVKQKLFASKFGIGNTFPNIKFKTISNNYYNLSDFTQKGYVLICYWASWCSPCRQNIPRLKNINNTFASKGLQIISISIDDNEKNWKDAVEKEQMPWTQICDIEKYIEGTSLRKMLYMTFIPQYYLLDKSGAIIYNNFMMKDDEDYSVLHKVLEKNYSN